MSKKKFIMPVLIKAGDSRMKKCFGEKVAAYDCHIVEACNLNNLICERDRLQAQRDELINALAEIQHYSPVGSTCYEIATRAINAMEDDQ